LSRLIKREKRGCQINFVLIVENETVFKSILMFFAEFETKKKKGICGPARIAAVGSLSSKKTNG
jgi:hypothetical protein